MSSLLKKHHTPGRPASRPTPRRAALGALVAVGLLSTVFSLALAGRAAPGGTASFMPAAATAQRAAVAAPAGHTSSSGSMSSGSMSTGATKAVAIKDYAFSPSSLTINVGDTVTWTNMDSAPHTVTVSSGPVKFSSGNLAKGQSFSYTFTKAGTYKYYCAVHPDMTGTVIVNGSTTPTPTPTPTPSPTPMPMPPADGCGGLNASVDAFLQHFYSAHLETSPGEQAAQALDFDQYVKTHTVMIENMVKPLVGSDMSSC
jgi:plastocyanin